MPGPDDFTVAFTFSLKARPRYKLGAIRFARIRCSEVNDLPSVPGFMRFVAAVRALHATGRRAEQATGRGSRESTQEQFPAASANRNPPEVN
jgi:hypothetical protein